MLNDPSKQILFPKAVLDIFQAPELPALLARLNADRYVVYGVVSEICVQFAAFGLLKIGKTVEIVTDAVQSLKKSEAAQVFSCFTSAGGRLTTAGEILA